MVQYTLNVHIAQNWVDYFYKYQWQFCFAQSAQSKGDETTMNVIAYADDVSNNITVVWNTDQAIAAAKTGYSAGNQITVSTNPLPINFGQSAILKDWAHFHVQDDVQAPHQGYLFDTTPTSAAVLYQTVCGQLRPVYITPETVLPPNSTERLTPLSSVAVWFQRDVTSGTMIDAKAVKPFVIPMTSQTMDATYDAQGHWHVSSESVDYTSGRFAQYQAALSQDGKGPSENGPNQGQNGYPQQKALEFR